MNQESLTNSAKADGPEEARGEDETELIAEEDRPGNGVPAMSSGTKVPRVELEDENSAAEEEVEEGIAEAALDTRLKSHH